MGCASASMPQGILTTPPPGGPPRLARAAAASGRRTSESGRASGAAGVRVGPTGRPAPRPGAGTGPGGDSAEGSGGRASESAPASMVKRPHILRGVRRAARPRLGGETVPGPGPATGRPAGPAPVDPGPGLPVRCAAHPRHGEEPSIRVGRGVPRRGPAPHASPRRRNRRRTRFLRLFAAARRGLASLIVPCGFCNVPCRFVFDCAATQIRSIHADQIGT
jgi:hypothetical protein